MKSKSFFAFAILAIFISSRTVRADDFGVKAWEESVVIPTYLIGPPDPNPQFYLGGQSQGAEHRIYPYPMYDNLTTQKVDKTYKMVYLENQYIKIGILPEIGGKVFEAIDKTNGYNFIYRQHVIKPALISLLGAWISGGIEWDVPHHHRATSFLPVQYKIEDAPGGGKTVWVGELELRDRMRWTVGLSLYPGKSYLQASFHMINRTPVPVSMLCFSNVAVSVNDNYQVIFPPSTQFVTYHKKVDFATWPIAHSFFNGSDFTAGVDVSWYKNHYSSNSMFAWNYQDDFFAGYDQGKQAGIMAIADHNVVPGKKFFTWGNSPQGHTQDTLLTDTDGPYIELMVGAYSDNQPDYSWLAPFETRTWNQYWYPFRDIDGVKCANTEAAVNLDVQGQSARVGFYTTSAHSAAQVSLTLNNKPLLNQAIAISPDKPFVQSVNLPVGANPSDLRASISADGKELVSYSPIKLETLPTPKVVTTPPDPAQVKTNDELYSIGLRIEAFHDPLRQAEPYWQEALKRDPGDVRVNTVLAIDRIKQARFADAEKLLRTALDRATDKYTSPKDGEPFYYLGLALKAQGKLDEAYTAFYKSTWTAAWRSPGYFELAQIASYHGDYAKGLDLVEQSIQANALNIQALTLKSALLRENGQEAEAKALAEATHAVDPLDVGALYERSRLFLDKSASDELDVTLRDHPANGLEVATQYMDAGLWPDAARVLAVSSAGDVHKVSPLIFYDQAYCMSHLLNRNVTADDLRAAEQASPEYVFPFQWEQIEVLEWAMALDPKDPHAPYYLGNLLYDLQPERAMALWEKSAALGANFPVVYRNLAIVYNRQDGGASKAQAALEKAASFGGNGMVFRDLDAAYEQESAAPDKRLAEFESHQPVINRDDAIYREINLKIFAGKYDDAIDLMDARFFRAWEGGGRVDAGDCWVNAHLGLGQNELAAKQYDKALADFQAAINFPANLQEAVGPAASRKSEAQYWVGVTYAAMGQKDKATQAWTDAAQAPAPAPTGRRGGGRGGRGGFGRGGAATAAGLHVDAASQFFQAMSMRKLGQNDQADAIMKRLLATTIPASGTAAADAHYLVGLGDFGSGNTSDAKAQFEAALKISLDHFAAKLAMQSLLSTNQ